MLVSVLTNSVNTVMVPGDKQEENNEDLPSVHETQTSQRGSEDIKSDYNKDKVYESTQQISNLANTNAYSSPTHC